MTKTTSTAPVLSVRELNRATLDRQLLLRRATLSATDAVEHLVGLQAQNVKPPYYALAARLEGFAPEELSAAMESREVVRIVTMRSTIHTHTADDCLTLRPLVQAARERELYGFRHGLAGVDLDRLTAISRELVETEPRTMKQLREALLLEWPDADPLALAIAARCRLPLVQVTPRGVWGRSGQVALTTAEHWLGRPAEPAPAPDATVLRYLAAFGPASVKDMQSWAGLTRLREVFERLRPQLVTFRDEHGVELFDLPDAPRPDADTGPAAAAARVRQSAPLPLRPFAGGGRRLQGPFLAGQPGLLHASRGRIPGGYLAAGGVPRRSRDHRRALRHAQQEAAGRSDRGSDPDAVGAEHGVLVRHPVRDRRTGLTAETGPAGTRPVRVRGRLAVSPRGPSSLPSPRGRPS